MNKKIIQSSWDENIQEYPPKKTDWTAIVSLFICGLALGYVITRIVWSV